MNALLESLHAAPGRGVISVAGGGSGAIAQLLATPGASRTLLEARVPYAERALAAWLGGRPDRACDPETARAMAMAGYRHALTLDDEASFGIGCTASLATDRTKRGDHRAHVALQTRGATHTLSVTLTPGARSRAEEEAVCDSLVLRALAIAKQVTPLPEPDLLASECMEVRTSEGHESWQRVVHAESQAEPHRGAETREREAPRIVLPGSFNPVHRGHTEMARLAQQRTGLAPTFELCVTNVDKPPLHYTAIEDRLAGFDPSADVWVTATPTFVEKARRFPGSVFAVGTDTIVRVGDPRYYGTERDRDAAIEEIAALGCSFLVFGRLADGGFETLADLTLVPGLHALCSGVDEVHFREDISSTELRSG